MYICKKKLCVTFIAKKLLCVRLALSMYADVRIIVFMFCSIFLVIDHNHARKRRSSQCITEFQPPFDKADFCFLINIPVKIDRIRSRRQKHNDLCVFLSAFQIAFFYPCGYFPAVRRVTPNIMALPILHKSILQWCEVKSAFRVLR